MIYLLPAHLLLGVLLAAGVAARDKRLASQSERLHGWVLVLVALTWPLLIVLGLAWMASEKVSKPRNGAQQ